MQGKVKEAVDQHRETAGQCSGRHAPPKLIICLTSREPFAKEHNQKAQSQKATHDAPVGKSLQVIIMSLLQTIEPVPRVVAWIDHAI